MVEYLDDKSTLFDNCANTHIVNKLSLLGGDIVPAVENDVMLVGETALAVVYRGTRTMKNILHGPDGPNTRDLVLKDAAFVPGFHTNIISGELIKGGFWICGADYTAARL